VRLRAFLADPNAENRVHNPTVARTLGFAGGLVPGVDTYAYLTRPVVERWGLEWLRHGWGEVRLLKPVYDGEELEIAFDGDTVTAKNVGGELCATLVVGLHGGPDQLSPLEDHPLPDRRYEASESSFRLHGFGTYRQTVTEEQAQHHLRDVRETLAVYDEQAILHPAHLLRFANTALSASYRLGPWLHVASHVQHAGPVRRGQEVEVRARLAGCFEKKGHRFVELDVQVTGARVRHTAIYEPAFAGRGPARRSERP
jgi:acyl dehydratase